MKTLKITLSLIAVLLLTVSGVQSEDTLVVSDENEIKQPTKIDLLAHEGKKEIKLPGQG
ncbi:hypothetical protein [Winogradskyella sp. SYSU M77433]|uniref:hypothetical protein n=1 Tax=Winogradskyella sp. SYSU M77433 TaxID=3042722 RepID=UPI0024807584|nr:hypothetical protein [Winogradskyella sp. SYSU M77433]MDH7912070.1 hypothetical protein [Winogradskyella sp. SYSU M77433]|tara:strand:- start:1183 stop:1359 length:177 start_codon:yes stop_codon:yes gene_type:complete